ncbi:phage gp6-like head-tail connector protein [Micromonospora sp. CPCC 205711]|uniref:head-tail connector protein n=1 Tax=Micromonospora sp. CPCC 205547 TaxID=3122400 RepID=UPI002FF026F3
MANEYTTLPLLKSYINETTSSNDSLLQQCLTSASRAIDSYCGRRFYVDTNVTTRTYRIDDRVVCDTDGDLLIVDDISTTTGLVVEVGSGSSWSTVTDYDTEPDNAIALGKPITYLRRQYNSWATSSRAKVRVTAKFGFPAVPDEVVQATLLQAARLFKRKDSVGGVLGADQFGASIRVSRIDSDVQALLRPFVIQAIG